MFCAKDSKGYNNPYLISHCGNICWGRKEMPGGKLLTFPTDQAAIAAGKEAMPPLLQDRVVAEPISG